jgi:hypothetical protein
MDAAKIYPLNKKNNDIVDEIFNKLHDQNKIE